MQETCEQAVKKVDEANVKCRDELKSTVAQCFDTDVGDSRATCPTESEMDRFSNLTVSLDTSTVLSNPPPQHLLDTVELYATPLSEKTAELYVESSSDRCVELYAESLSDRCVELCADSSSDKCVELCAESSSDRCVELCAESSSDRCVEPCSRTVELCTKPSSARTDKLYAEPLSDRCVDLCAEPLFDRCVDLCAEPLSDRCVDLYAEPLSDRCVDLCTNLTSEKTVELYAEPSSHNTTTLSAESSDIYADSKYLSRTVEVCAEASSLTVCDNVGDVTDAVVKVLDSRAGSVDRQVSATTSADRSMYSVCGVDCDVHHLCRHCNSQT